AAPFGSYGWSGEGNKLLAEDLAGAGFALVNEGFKTQWVPDEEVLAACQEYGREFVKSL
ncbi:MAG: anaerobic nitric oxide reductase flavorubredoxin, partial [Firmicutes bacterium]|nr:anaerobic nitric oxide reductase flavorubredoxin [Bacillota bacterium]